jgi:ubiquinone/menaquinone biosynthesis C-methylase UbiE
MKESRIPSTPSTPLSANNDVLFFHRARMFTQPALRVSWPQALRTSNKTPASAGAGRTASFPTGRGGAHPRVVLSALRALHQTARQAGVGRTAGFPADRGGANWRRVLLDTLSGECIRRWGRATLRRLLGRRATPPTQLAVLEGYARWAATYEQDMDGHPLVLAESGTMQALLPSCKGIVALDAACGTGRYARLLAAQGARRVIAVDQSAAMLERARALAAPLSGAKILFKQGSLLHLPLDAHSCDLAIVALALAHLETAQLEQAFAEFSRILKPGGVLLMSEMHPFGALTGGRCRFETAEGGQRHIYHIETHTHLHEEYLAAARAANLTLEALREPRLTPDLVPAFERANMAAFARQFANFPLALVCRWRTNA